MQCIEKTFVIRLCVDMWNITYVFQRPTVLIMKNCQSFCITDLEILFSTLQHVGNHLRLSVLMTLYKFLQEHLQYEAQILTRNTLFILVTEETICLGATVMTGQNSIGHVSTFVQSSETRNIVGSHWIQPIETALILP